MQTARITEMLRQGTRIGTMARPLELPYDTATRCAERYAWFEAIRPLGWPVFLDSGDPARSGERYDILAAGPGAVTTSRDAPFAAARPST